MLGPGVVVESGAEVHDSVVFADTVVRAGARVHWSVVWTPAASSSLRRRGCGIPERRTSLDDPDAVTRSAAGSQAWSAGLRGRAAGWGRGIATTLTTVDGAGIGILEQAAPMIQDFFRGDRARHLRR